MATKICQYCGNTLEETQKFCQSCGKAQGPQEATSPNMEGAQAVEQAAPAQQQAPEQQAQTFQQQTPPVYAAPVQQQAPNQQAQVVQPDSDLNKPLSVGHYILMFIVTGIPLVGIIMLFVWAFGGNTNKNRKNYAIAALILMLISLVLSIVFIASLIPILASVFNSFLDAV